MISAVLARRYARALLGLAEKRGDLEKTHQDLETISRVFEANPRVRRFFEAPNIARTEKEAFLEKRFKPKANKNVYGLLVLLLRRRRFDRSPASSTSWPRTLRASRARSSARRSRSRTVRRTP